MDKEKRLAEKLKNGSTAALEKIIDNYSSYVCTVIRNFSRGCLSDGDVDELCIDVFFNLWRQKENLDPDLGLRPYLSAAARNGVKNRFRNDKSDKLKLLSDSDISELEIADDFSTEERAELNRTMSCLNEGLKELSPRDRDIFLRFYFYGEKVSKIAEKTGLTEGSVKSVLSRTRAKLKEYLTSKGFAQI